MVPSQKFHIEGGRAGFITFLEAGGSGRLGWEMLVGDFSMVIYSRECHWLTPSERQMDPHDVRRLAQEFSTEANIAVEIDFPEGAEGVWPTPGAQLTADRSFYDLLGPERSEKPCRHANCQRGAISQSVLCRVHHFESVRRRTCPFNDIPKSD